MRLLLYMSGPVVTFRTGVAVTGRFRLRRACALDASQAQRFYIGADCNMRVAAVLSAALIMSREALRFTAACAPLSSWHQWTSVRRCPAQAQLPRSGV